MPELKPMTGVEDTEEEKIVPSGDQSLRVSSSKYAVSENGIPMVKLVLVINGDDEDDYLPIYVTLFPPHDEMEAKDVRRALREFKRAAEAMNVDIHSDWRADENVGDFLEREVSLNVRHQTRKFKNAETGKYTDTDGSLEAVVRFPRFA